MHTLDPMGTCHGNLYGIVGLRPTIANVYMLIPGLVTEVPNVYLADSIINQ